mmetsp:Transcript_27860/g.47180  ORF Transcript_27860/g.47180 Transcript_27860/m.47180 type:complete len:107 (+) Transcript_27860:1136-1456(+)
MAPRRPAGKLCACEIADAAVARENVPSLPCLSYFLFSSTLHHVCLRHSSTNVINARSLNSVHRRGDVIRVLRMRSSSSSSFSSSSSLIIEEYDRLKFESSHVRVVP